MPAELNYLVKKKKKKNPNGAWMTQSGCLPLQPPAWERHQAEDGAGEVPGVGSTRGFEGDIWGDRTRSSCFLNLARICPLCQICANETFLKLGGLLLLISVNERLSVCLSIGAGKAKVQRGPVAAV